MLRYWADFNTNTNGNKTEIHTWTDQHSLTRQHLQTDHQLPKPNNNQPPTNQPHNNQPTTQQPTNQHWQTQNRWDGRTAISLFVWQPSLPSFLLSLSSCVGVVSSFLRPCCPLFSFVSRSVFCSRSSMLRLSCFFRFLLSSSSLSSAPPPETR